MKNLKSFRRVGVSFLAVALILGISVTVPGLGWSAGDVKERDISAKPEATASPSPGPQSKTDNPADLAKEDLSGGFKSVGRGFKNGTKATGGAFKKAGVTMGRSFKKAGVTMGRGFKTAGRAIRDFFLGKKSEDAVKEKDLVASDKNIVEEDAAQKSGEDLDAVGNEDATREDT